MARRSWLGLGALVVALALTGSFRVVPPPAVQILNPDLVAAASWLRSNSPKDAGRAAVVGAPMGPMAYWLQVGLLGQRRDRVETAVRAFSAAPPSPESWLVDERLPSIAIVPRLESTIPGMRVEARFGSVAIVRRAGKLDPAALNPLTIRYKTFWEDQRLKTAIELQRPQPGVLPLIELRLMHAGSPPITFPLPPDGARNRPQYLGADVLPATLGGQGYINQSAYPTFAAPTIAPTGAMTLTLRLSLNGNTLDERVLATMRRSADGRFEELAPNTGELIYLRREPPDDNTIGDNGVEFAGVLRLRGVRAPARAQPGDELAIDLRWQALRSIDRSLFPEVQILDAQGQPVAANLAAPQAGFYPTWRWRAGESVADPRRIALPRDLPAGTYGVAVLVHDFGAGQTAAQGWEGKVIVGEIMVED